LYAKPSQHSDDASNSQNISAFRMIRASHGAWVGAYVLMPDHLYLFVATNDEQMTIRLDEVFEEHHLEDAQ